MPATEYHLLSTTDINMVADLKNYTKDGWKPILLSSSAVLTGSRVSVHVVILLEK
jgi:hypothetical protein